MPITAKPKLYNPRHPERTLLYQTVAEHYETWLELASAGQFDGQGDHHTPKPFVRKAFATYLECGTSDKRGAKADELHLTPLELIDRIAALVPPPRTHRHRYFGVLAPNSPLRAAVTALAQPAASQPATVETAQPGAGVPGVAAPGNAATPTPEPEARPKRAAHYLWAVLIARIYEAFPLLCPMCGGQMRIIAFITHSAEIRHILNHIGVESAPPHITPARGPPLWEGCDAPVDDGAQGEPDWDLAAQPDEVDQRVNW
ncbi:MAG: transposase [Rhodoferax sp.]